MPGRSVLVTGAAQGLGLAIAEEFAAAGYRVAVADRNAAALAVAAHQLRDRDPAAKDDVMAVTVDVTDDDSVDTMVSSVSAWAGGIDVLVNSAGVIARIPSDELDSRSWSGLLDVNLGGTFRCARAAFQHLRASTFPSVLNIGSLGSLLGMPLRLAYNTSKAGVLGVTRTLAAEWGPLGIRVNAIVPGFIDTAMMRSGIAAGNLDEELMLRRIPMRRLGKASEISGVALFLASPAASYINGAAIPIDGGTTIDGTFF